MSWGEWAFFRTVGHLAGNAAYYGTKQKQKQSLEKHLPLAVAEQVDVSQLEKEMRKEFAERMCGPSNPEWERKIRTGVLRMQKELKYLKDIPSWSDANWYRLQEIGSFFMYIQEDEDTTNDLRRLDILEGARIGGEALMDSALLLQSLLNERTFARVAECGPKCQAWFRRTMSHADQVWVLAETCLGVSSRPETMTRKFGELNIGNL